MNVDALDVVVAYDILSGVTHIRAGCAALPIEKLAHASELDARRTERAGPAGGRVFGELKSGPGLCAGDWRVVHSRELEAEALRGVSDGHWQTVTRASRV